MHRRLKMFVALAGAASLLLQGVLASAPAIACVKACDSAGTTSAPPAQPSCHSSAKRDSHSSPQHKCDGTCGQLCSLEKSDATSAQTASEKLPTFEVAADVPVASVLVTLVPASSPELHVTDSSPPGLSLAALHLLRAPPMLGA